MLHPVCRHSSVPKIQQTSNNKSYALECICNSGLVTASHHQQLFIQLAKHETLVANATI